MLKMLLIITVHVKEHVEYVNVFLQFYVSDEKYIKNVIDYYIFIQIMRNKV